MGLSRTWRFTGDGRQDDCPTLGVGRGRTPGRPPGPVGAVGEGGGLAREEGERAGASGRPSPCPGGGALSGRARGTALSGFRGAGEDACRSHRRAERVAGRVRLASDLAACASSAGECRCLHAGEQRRGEARCAGREGVRVLEVRCRVEWRGWAGSSRVGGWVGAARNCPGGVPPGSYQGFATWNRRDGWGVGFGGRGGDRRRGGVRRAGREMQ